MTESSSARRGEWLMQSSGWRRLQEDGTKEDGPEAVHRLEVRRPDRNVQNQIRKSTSLLN